MSLTQISKLCRDFYVMPMSETDRELLIRGLEKAEYNTLRMKAMRNEMVLKDDSDGSIIRVPAREVFVQLYHEAVPVF